MLIGKKLKALRKECKISLTELSKRSGVQLATLSRIENMKMTGTLESHMNIAKALGIPLPHLYSDAISQSQKAEQQIPNTQNSVFIHSDKSSYEVLTGNILSKKMMPILLKLESGGKTNAEQNQVGTEKFVFVLEGAVEVKIGNNNYKLQRHHTLYFDASLPYYIENKGKVSAKVLCVSTPVAL